jgi:heat shock protein beta
MAAWAKMQKKTFEINPKHPLIEALLERVEEADSEDSVEAASLKESAEVLW